MRCESIVPYKPLLRLRFSNHAWFCTLLLISIIACHINLGNAQNYHCNGLYILSNTTGHITDHFGAETYQESVTCFWQTQFNFTSNDSYITLLFNSFQLELDWDYLYVYEGNITNPWEIELLAAFTGYDLPRPVMTKSSNIYIQFQSDELIVFAGFDLEYHLANCSSRCNNNGYCIGNTCYCDIGWTGDNCSIKDGCSNDQHCGGTTRGSCSPEGYCNCQPGFYGPTCQQEYCEELTLLTSTSGTFSSHVAKGEYQVNQHCSWIIDPSSTVTALDPSDHVDSVTLQVNYFYIDPADLVVLYGNDIRDTDQIYNYTGYMYSNADYDLYVRDSENIITTLNGVYQSDTTVVSQSGRMIVEFESDQVAVRPGFQFTYTSCLKSYCSYNGYCYRNSCICDLGFTGPNCETPEVSCPNNCSQHGTCATECECDSEWTGVDCNVALDLQTAPYPVVSYSPFLDKIQITADSTPTYLECRYSNSIIYNVTIPINITSGSILGISPSFSDENISNADIIINLWPCYNHTIPGNLLLRFTWLNLTLNETLTVFTNTGAAKLVEIDATTSLSSVYPIVAKQPVAIILKRNLTNYGMADISATIPFQIYFEISRCTNGCSNGECVLGTCQCYPGWSGTMCQTRMCERNCSGNGLCVDGSCQCFPGFSGGVCEAPTCNGNVTITNFTTVVVSDHVIGGHYWPGLQCGFLFQAPINSTLSIFFSTQQMQTFWDILTLYDGPSKQSPVVFSSDDSILPDPHRSQGSNLFLSFRTDSRTQYSGFTATVYVNQLCNSSCMSSPSSLCYSSDFDSPNPNLAPECLCDGPSCYPAQEVTLMTPETFYEVSLPDFQWVYFKYYVDRPAGELSIEFMRAYNQSGFPFPELYIKFGNLPSHSSFDIFRSYATDQGELNNTLVKIPNPDIGMYYIGVYGLKIEHRRNNTFILSAKASCPIGCAEHGYCDGTNMCHCVDELCWSGYDCSTAVKNCSFVGVCTNGDCECPNDFFGANCEQPVCDPPCQNGRCAAGEDENPNWCDCSGTPYGGEWCQTWLNLTCTPECLHEGICVGTNQACDCSQTGGYYGWRCEQFSCTDICEFGECVAPDVCLCYYGATRDGCNPAPVTASAFVLTIVAAVIGIFACVVVMTTIILIVKLVKATTVVRPIIGQAGADERTTMK